MTLLLACDITIAVLVREPTACAVTLAVAVAASASTSAASSEDVPRSTPLVMSNGAESVIVPLGCLKRTTPVAAAKIIYY